MLDRNLENVSLEDIKRLVADRTPEGLRLEYKAETNVNTEDGKAELIEDIVSFANSAGGDLIIGVPEAVDAQGKRLGYHGEPTGMPLENDDAFRQSIENTLRDRVEPRLVGITYKFLRVGEAFVVVIRIPKSYSLHLIRKKSWFKCVARNAAGKYPLDASQVRNELLLADALPQRIASFRQERLAHIAADETPIPVQSIGKIVTHLLPVASFTGTQVNISQFSVPALVVPKGPFTSLINSTHNIDGLLSWSNGSDGKAIAYLQTFRNGALENVETGLGGSPRNKPQFGEMVDGYVINGIYRLIKVLSQLQIAPPIFAAISFVGVKDYTIWPGESLGSPCFIDRDIIALPEIEIENLELNPQEIAIIMKPVLDILYQASGYKVSWNFDQDGKYIHRLGADYVG